MHRVTSRRVTRSIGQRCLATSAPAKPKAASPPAKNNYASPIPQPTLNRRLRAGRSVVVLPLDVPSGAQTPNTFTSNSNAYNQEAAPWLDTVVPPSHVGRFSASLAHLVSTSPIAAKLFNGLTFSLGLQRENPTAGRTSYHLYGECIPRTPERMFGAHIPKSASQEPSTPTCSDPGAAAEAILPHTLQHWFLLANLHVWMLSVRLRAIHPAHGHSASHIQGLIDHLFMDVEDRIRLVLQPPSTHVEPYTMRSTFYPSPTHPLRSRGAPERLVSTQMKVFREQYRGMGVALDYALATNSDHHMAAALWRNILGARGREGLGLSDVSTTHSVEDGVDGDALVESKPSSDATAVPHDPLAAPLPSSSYLSFPPFLLQITAYVRRNLARLDAIDDEAFVHGTIPQLRHEIGNWGDVPTMRELEQELVDEVHAKA